MLSRIFMSVIVWFSFICGAFGECLKSDVNNDGIVDFSDFLEFGQDFGKTSNCPVKRQIPMFKDARVEWHAPSDSTLHIEFFLSRHFGFRDGYESQQGVGSGHEYEIGLMYLVNFFDPQGYMFSSPIERVWAIHTRHYTGGAVGQYWFEIDVEIHEKRTYPQHVTVYERLKSSQRHLRNFHITTERVTKLQNREDALELIKFYKRAVVHVLPIAIGSNRYIWSFPVYQIESIEKVPPLPPLPSGLGKSTAEAVSKNRLNGRE